MASKTEETIGKLLKERYPHIRFEYETHSVLPNDLELDIFLPDYNIAIEINGYFHYHKPHKRNTYNYAKWKKCVTNDRFKIDWCKQNNITLIVEKIDRTYALKRCIESTDNIVSKINPIIKKKDRIKRIQKWTNLIKKWLLWSTSEIAWYIPSIN